MSIATSSPCGRSGSPGRTEIRPPHCHPERSRGTSSFRERQRGLGRWRVLAEIRDPSTSLRCAQDDNCETSSTASHPASRSAFALQSHFQNAGAKLFACCRESPASASFSLRVSQVFAQKSRGKPAKAAVRLSDRSAANHPAATAAPVQSAANTSPGAKRIFIPRRMPSCSMRDRSELPKASE